MKRRTTTLVISLVCLVLMLASASFMAACGGGTSTPPTSPTTGGSQPVVSEWEIPFICTQTGPVASWGLDAAWGVEFAVEQINASGGIRGLPVKLVEYDTGYDSAKAVQAMASVIKDSLVIIGPWDEMEALAAGSIAVDEKVFFFCPPADPERIYGEFDSWATTVTTSFRVVYDSGPKEWLTRNPSIKSVVIILSPDDTAQMTYLEYLKDALESAGVELLGTVEVPVSTLDLGPAVIKALNYHADGYISVIMSDLAAKMMVEFSNRGLPETERWKILLSGGASGPALYEDAKGYIDGAYMFDTMNPFYEGDRWQTLVAAYGAEHNGAHPWFPPIVFHYDVPYIIKAAFEDLKITGDPAKLDEERLKIRDYINSLTGFEGVQYQFDMANGGIEVPTLLFQIQDNKPVVVASIPPE